MGLGLGWVAARGPTPTPDPELTALPPFGSRLLRIGGKVLIAHAG